MSSHLTVSPNEAGGCSVRADLLRPPRDVAQRGPVATG